MISAEVIADSINDHNTRITTFALRYPRIIHAEFMTHRVFSRNASSSRAVPTPKLIEEARSDELRAYPVEWGRNQKGMQAGEPLPLEQQEHAHHVWSCAARRAADFAEELSKMGLHKQIANRVLEPFTHINVLVTSTEFHNFFGLRLHKDADPTMQALARAMWEAHWKSQPNYLEPGNWHLPYVRDQERMDYCHDEDHETLLKISVARCARVSYKSFETGKLSTVAEDVILYDKLLSAQPIHPSPAEHQATPDESTYSADAGKYVYGHPEQWGNFHGWRQYRKMLPGENLAPIPDEFLDF